ncbi:MAG TPA: pyruvate kinase [Kiloniellales bacterium]|nr:pyruvate kinase [Kiloniellales bacterium]
MRRTRSAKIVATLGPATSDPSVIRRLFEAGADVFRLNFSHGSHEEHRRNIEILRELEVQSGRSICILQDLQGPKLRVGRLESGSVILQAGDPFRLDLDKAPGNDRRAPLPHPEIFSNLQEGTLLLLDDGRLRLEVTKAAEDHAETRVLVGGPLKERKGVNIPSVVLPISPLTAKDRTDLNFGLEMGVDWVALSFVQRPEDVAELRKLVAGRAAVMVKVEKPAAVEGLDQLLELSDGVMVARGDLGVELAPEDIPGVQKDIIRACRLAGKIVVVATQMLESMVRAPAPTRAEASDVATAIYDGADAVMLSAESAVGSYPVEAVAMMNRIIERTERDSSYRAIIEALDPEPEPNAADAISEAAAQVATTISAAAIVTYTTSGSTALRAGRRRPRAPILLLTSELSTARRFVLLWGAHCVHTADVHSLGEMVEKATTIARQESFASSGSKLVITAGVPFGTPGATNVLRIAWVE